jgi:hypothetical protein
MRRQTSSREGDAGKIDRDRADEVLPNDPTGPASDRHGLGKAQFVSPDAQCLAACALFPFVSDGNYSEARNSPDRTESLASGRKPMMRAERLVSTESPPA